MRRPVNDNDTDRSGATRTNYPGDAVGKWPKPNTIQIWGKHNRLLTVVAHIGGAEKLMRISARLQITPTADRRGWQRRRLSLGSSLQSTGDDVTIHDISASGMLIETAAELAVFDALEIELPETGITPALVIWNSGQYFGCEFKQRLSQGAISAALLRSQPAASAELELPLPLPEPQSQESTPGESESQDLLEEQKAPFGVRLRVIFGSALLLWALIIWAAVALHNLSN